MIEHKCDRCKQKIDWGQRVLIDVVDVPDSDGNTFQRYELCPTCYSGFKDNFLHDFDEVFTETTEQEDK